jgi:hypothetical protein
MAMCKKVHPLTLDLSTNIISGVLPPGVDPGIGNHTVFGRHPAFTASDLLAHSVTDNVAPPGTFTPGAAIQAFLRPNPISSSTEATHALSRSTSSSGPTARRMLAWPPVYAVVLAWLRY